MAASGVSVQDEVVTVFTNLKLKKKHQYVTFKLTDDLKEIMVEQIIDKGPDASYDKFVEGLPDDDCRYAVYDYHITMGDSGERDRLMFVVWNPDCARIKQKMLYASSKDALKKKLIGIYGELQATDKGELCEKEMREKAEKK